MGRRSRSLPDCRVEESAGDMRGGWPGPGPFRLQETRQVQARGRNQWIVLRQGKLSRVYQSATQRADHQVQTRGDN